MSPSALRAAFTTVLVAAIVTLIAGVGFAQEDALLERYDRAVANLDSAVANLEGDPAQARDDLDRAFNTLVTLAGSTENAPLISAMERIFERAQTALGNGSTVDLSVQTAVLEGGFQRVLLDAGLVAAREGDVELGRQRVVAVATDAGFPAESISALQGAADARDLQLLAESTSASRVADLVRSTSEQLDTDLDGAYATFGQAYGTFLLVQDSPRIDAEVNATFTAAAQAIVDEDPEAASLALGDVAARLEALAVAAEAVRTGRPASTTPPPSADTAAETPTTETVETPQVDTDETPEASEAPAAQPSNVGTTDDAAATDVPPETVDAAAAVAADQARTDAIDGVVAELASTGLSEADRTAVATTVVDDGFTSYGDVLGALRLSTADLLVAVGRGDAAGQTAAFDAFDSTYRAYVAPVATVTAPELADQTDVLYQRLSEAAGLRIQDVAVLATHARLLTESVDGGVAPATHTAQVQTVGFWVGWVRVIFVIVFGLLALVPLVLLNLAFGGGNRNWQLVGSALFLLMLPILFEAVAYLGTLAVEFAGVDALSSIGTWSIFQNELSQVIWAAVTAVAILLAIIGLYGICVQFGILGGSRRSPSATQTGTSTAEDTLVDWDEEL